MNPGAVQEQSQGQMSRAGAHGAGWTETGTGQDNDPKHTTELVTKWLEDSKSTFWRTYCEKLVGGNKKPQSYNLKVLIRNTEEMHVNF